MPRVVLAEDSFIVREGLREILESHDRVEVVATCADLDAIFDAVERHAPDALVTDIRMPPSCTDEGIRAAVELRDRAPELGVVVLSAHDDPAYVLDLLAAGSAGRAYLLKQNVHDRLQLTAAVDAVVAGGSMIDPRVVEVLVGARRRVQDSPLAELTPREMEVLGELAAGRSNAAIADELVLTKRAVEKHIHSIFMKLDLAYAEDVSKRVKAALLFLADRQLR